MIPQPYSARGTGKFVILEQPLVDSVSPLATPQLIPVPSLGTHPT